MSEAAALDDMMVVVGVAMWVVVRVLGRVKGEKADAESAANATVSMRIILSAVRCVAVWLDGGLKKDVGRIPW